MIDFLKKPWVIFAVAIPFFFCMNRYLGILIDGPLYVLQVMHRWFPERFIGDPPFMFGNQDSFTIFSPVYGFFMRNLPIDVAAMLVTFGIQLFFAVSFIMLVRAVARLKGCEHWTLPLSLVFFVLYCFGSGKAIIFFSMLVESYPVPRTLAVALAILGLSFLFHKNKWITPIITMVGVMFHPLMAGWVLPVWLFYHFPKTRIPVIAISALFPLTAYIGVVPFSPYPDGWYYKQLTYRPCMEYILRFFVYIAFFTLFVKKVNVDERIRKFCYSVLIVSCIAFYWYLWTGINRFILLYQFQTWRAEWLCIVASYVLFSIVLYDAWTRYKETRTLTTWNVAPIPLAVSIFTDTHSPEGLILAIVLLLLPCKKIDLKIATILALYYPVFNLFISGVLCLFYLGAPFLNSIDFSVMQNTYYSHTFITIAVSIVFAVYSLKKREWLRVVLFALYLVFSQFLILPIYAILWPYLKKWQKIAIPAVILLDGLWGFDYRIKTIPIEFLNQLQVLGAVVIIACGLLIVVLCKKRKENIAQIVALLSLLFSIPYAAFNWDFRDEQQKIEERAIDQFKWQTVFPQITERGKIFFYVKGYLREYSRMRFLSGSYVDTKTPVGEIFSEGHYKESAKRLLSLIYKNAPEKSFSGMMERLVVAKSFFRDSLAIPSILIDRVNYLCEKREISHLVSDFDQLPYAKQDSLTMNVLNKEIYLYACPPDNNQISKKDEN